MELEHEFTVPVPREAAWSLLLDVERVAPCMPGATLDSVEGDEYIGRLKVRLGAMTITYRGSARIVSADEQERTVTIEGSGKEARGSGTATATINARLQEEGDSTRVSVRTKLNVTGRPAQFGHDTLSEVGAKLIDRFAKALALEVEPARATEAGVGTKKTAKTTPKAAPETEPAGKAASSASSGTADGSGSTADAAAGPETMETTPAAEPAAAALEPGRPLEAVEAAPAAEAVEAAPTVEAIEPAPTTPEAQGTADSSAEGTATPSAEARDIVDPQAAAQAVASAVDSATTSHRDEAATATGAAAASAEPPLRPVTPISSARRNEGDNDDAINLMEVAGPAVAKRAAPVAAALVAVFAIRHLVRRRRGRHHRR